MQVVPCSSAPSCARSVLELGGTSDENSGVPPFDPWPRTETQIPSELRARSAAQPCPQQLLLSSAIRELQAQLSEYIHDVSGSVNPLYWRTYPKRRREGHNQVEEVFRFGSLR